jgi:hypothetical protein
VSLTIHFRVIRGDTCSYRTKRVSPPSQRTLPSLPYLGMVLNVWRLRLHEPLEQTVMQRVELVETHAHKGVSRREPDYQGT